MDFSSIKSKYLTTAFGDSDGGYIFDRGHSRDFEPLGTELKNRFDVVVDMNEYHTTEKGKSMATFGLCGCIGGYIDNPESNTFFHYDPMSIPMIEALVRNDVSAQTAKVNFFVPGEWGRDSTGRYQMQPKKEYSEGMLASAIAHIQSQGIKYGFHCYDENRSHGNDYFSRYQGTAWVDREGKLFANGLAVANNSSQEPNIPNPP